MVLSHSLFQTLGCKGPDEDHLRTHTHEPAHTHKLSPHLYDHRDPYPDKPKGWENLALIKSGHTDGTPEVIYEASVNKVAHYCVTLPNIGFIK